MFDDSTTTDHSDDWQQRLNAKAEQSVRAEHSGADGNDLLQFFNPILAKHYRDVAGNIPTAPEMIAMANVAAVASVCATNMTARLKPDYPTGLIVWTIGLNDTGSSKTDSAKAGHGGLKACQELEDQNHKLEMAAFKGTPSERPVRKLMNLSGGTVQGQITQLANTDGAAYRFQDEVIGFWKGMNESNGGKGADEEKWLELWNGNAYTEVNRGAFTEVAQPRISMMGMSQPKVFLPMMARLTNDGRTGANGMFARFLIFHPQMPKKQFMSFENYMNGAQVADDWSGLNGQMMRKLYTLDHHIEWIPDEEGHRFLFDTWNEHFRMEAALPDHKGFVKAFLNKDRAHVCRLAAVLAAMDLGLEPGTTYSFTPSERVQRVVPVETLKRAVGLYRYFLGQVEQIWESMQGDQGRYISPEMAKTTTSSPKVVIEKALEKHQSGDFIIIRDLQQGSLRSLGLSASQLREAIIEQGLAKPLTTGSKKIVKI